MLLGRQRVERSAVIERGRSWIELDIFHMAEENCVITGREFGVRSAVECDRGMFEFGKTVIVRSEVVAGEFVRATGGEADGQVGLFGSDDVHEPALRLGEDGMAFCGVGQADED